MSFAAPAAGSGFTPTDANGHLLIIEPLAHETGIPTAFGDKDAIRATVHDIDDGVTYDDALIFSGGLIGSLKARVGQRVLARLGQGVAKPGQQPPWVLNDATGNPTDISAAEAYLAKHAAEGYAAPQAAQSAPAAAAAAPTDDAAIAAAQALLAQQGMLK